MKKEMIMLAAAGLLACSSSNVFANGPEKENKPALLKEEAWPGIFREGSYEAGNGWESWRCKNDPAPCLVVRTTGTASYVQVVSTGQIYDVGSDRPIEIISNSDGSTTYKFQSIGF